MTIRILHSAALPYLVETARQQEMPSVDYCRRALTSGGQLGTMGSIAWSGEIISMDRSVSKAGTMKNKSLVSLNLIFCRRLWNYLSIVDCIHGYRLRDFSHFLSHSFANFPISLSCRLSLSISPPLLLFRSLSIFLSLFLSPTLSVSLSFSLSLSPSHQLSLTHYLSLCPPPCYFSLYLFPFLSLTPTILHVAICQMPITFAMTES